MSMDVVRRSSRAAAAKILKQARIKQSRTDSNADYLMVCEKFITAVMKVRAAMKAAGATDFNNYDLFFGGFEQCDIMLQSEAYMKSSEAQFAYSLLTGADSWLKHEADKLGEAYVSPEHFYKCWDQVGIDLRPKKPNEGSKA